MDIKNFYLAHCESFYKAYPAVREWFSDKRALTALKIISKLSTGLLYAAYIIGFFARGYSVLGKKTTYGVHDAMFFIAPALTFFATTVIRSGINAKRPYERYDLVPLILKSTKGKSCPSRHTACAFAVAFAYLFGSSPDIGFDFIPGALFLIAAVTVAVSRPLAGVHFPLDVVFGAVIAVVCFGVTFAVYMLCAPIL
ncbi:MAG: phosphatase PAP2 family protein [Oscillospiraceae bacterium]|nr:phosphatase PAP2 family protein [Oscillospiraceae bacterium]